MSKRRKHQYIVKGQRGLLELCYGDDNPRGGVLMYGDVATVFPSWESAKRAIDRSARYSKAKGFNWECWRFGIVRLGPKEN